MLSKNGLNELMSELKIDKETAKNLVKSVDQQVTWLKDNLFEVAKIGFYIMIFQLGTKGYGKYSNVCKPLSRLDYPKAIRNIRSSKWFEQNPTQANEFIKRLEKAEKRFKNLDLHFVKLLLS